MPSNATAYFEELGGTIENGSSEVASLWVDASQDEDSQKWRIDAAIYAKPTSFGADPSFGNMVLQSIAQQMTGKSKLKLSFKYTLWKQSITEYMEVNPKYAFSLIAIGNVTTSQLEGLLISFILIAKVKGFFDMAVMRGATRQSYVLSRMVLTFLIYLVFE